MATATARRSGGPQVELGPRGLIDSDFIAVREISIRVGMTVLSLDRWRKEGRMPPCFMFGRLRKWKRTDINAWIEAGCPDISKSK